MWVADGAVHDWWTLVRVAATKLQLHLGAVRVAATNVYELRPPGLHNKFTKLPGCQILTVVFVYAKLAGRVKFWGCQILWQLQGEAAVKFYNTWQLQLHISYESGCGQNLKKLEIYDIIKGQVLWSAQKI